MKLKCRKFLLQIKISFLFVLAFSNTSICQDSYYKLKSQNLSVVEILEKWSHISDKTLNYSVDDLESTKFTFSIEGTYQEISSKLYPFLGLQYKVLDEVTIITVSANPPIQPDKISIRVIDEDQQPLPFVHLRIKSLGILDVSSINGDVTFETLLSDSDTITFNYIGYEESDFTLGNIMSYNNTVQLNPSTESISEIIVVGSTFESTSLEKIDPSSIPQAGSVDQDVITIAQNLPGISNPSESFQDLIIRGGSPDQVQYQWNGIRILQASHFFGKVSSINPYMIDKVEISKDGYSASTQGTVSGGLHMKSKNRIDSLSTSIHLNLLYANIGLSIPITPTFSAKVAIRQSLPSSLQSPLANAFQQQTFQFGKIPDEDFLINEFELQELVQTETTIQYGDRQISLWYQPTPKLTINADFIHLDNRLDFTTMSEVLETSTKDALYQSNLGYNLSANHYWNTNLATTLEYSHSAYSYEYQEIPDNSATLMLAKEQTNDIGLNNLKLTNKLQFKKIKATIGYEYNSWNTEVIFADRSQNTEDQYSNSTNENVAFITLHPEIISDLHIDFGIRYSAYNKSENNRKLIEPRLHMKYRLNSHLQLHGHYGKYHQYLSRRNFFTPFQADNGFWYLADESATDFFDFVNIIESRQFGGGVDLSYGFFDYSLDIFQKNIFNAYSSSFDLSTNENPFNVTDVEIIGAELMLRFQKKNHKILSTYEYNDEKLLFDNIEQPSLNPFSQPHRFNLAYEYNWKILSSTIQYNFAKGRPFSQANQVLIENNSASIEFADLLENRVPDYHRVNLNLRTIPFGKKIKHSFGIQINNIFNRRNIIKNQYFINLLANPVELGILEKQGIVRSFNLFWQVDI